MSCLDRHRVVWFEDKQQKIALFTFSVWVKVAHTCAAAACVASAADTTSYSDTIEHKPALYLSPTFTPDQVLLERGEGDVSVTGSMNGPRHDRRRHGITKVTGCN